MGTAAIISLILAILTALPSLIQAAEALHTQAGAGPLKKGFVLDALAKALAVTQAADPKLAKILTPDVQAKIQELAGQTVDSAVAVMNADTPKPGG
jgi:hypothetical protein